MNDASGLAMLALFGAAVAFVALNRARQGQAPTTDSADTASARDGQATPLTSSRQRKTQKALRILDITLRSASAGAGAAREAI